MTSVRLFPFLDHHAGQSSGAVSLVTRASFDLVHPALTDDKAKLGYSLLALIRMPDSVAGSAQDSANDLVVAESIDEEFGQAVRFHQFLTHSVAPPRAIGQASTFLGQLPDQFEPNAPGFFSPRLGTIPTSNEARGYAR